MATAEEQLREAQYAFQCISFGESSSNARNRRKASSISRKIIQKYPGTMEASEAHAILRRLGEEAYTSNIRLRHRHISEQEHHKPLAMVKPPAAVKARSRVQPGPGVEPLARVENRTFITNSTSDNESLDWAGLLSLLLALPKALLGMIILGGLILFGIFGPFLLIPLGALVLFAGPLRGSLNSDQQRQVNGGIRWVNEVIADRRRGGST
ncbi:MAG: hypothetical protein AAFN50_07770 [Pseudomonadota bacterium]